MASAAAPDGAAEIASAKSPATRAPRSRPKSAADEPLREGPSSPVVVGVGASAGGLEAFTQLLKHVPVEPGVAFVLVQHLDPKHESALPVLLARATAMPVREAKDGERLRADHVYVIPPGMDITLEDGHLRLVPRPANRAPHMPLDLFLGTLARVQGRRAIAVILSGTGSDGTLGCKAVKEAGGIAFAQLPSTAKYDGMPRSVIAAGCVDFVLPPREIARQILRLARDPYVNEPSGKQAPLPGSDDPVPLQRIFALLKKATSADFSCYKKPTLTRRIQRRMVLAGIETMADYARRLEGDPSEVEALHHDLLINVTSFFRDPEAFEALRAQVLPSILHGRSADSPVRVWVPGCATGEEAYSIAMCLLESLSDRTSNPPLQVFATDLSEAAIDKARAGVYLESIAGSVSPERLARFFVKVDGRYQVSKAVRDLIVFARQDLARDPPFSRLDLVSCRNVLIYLEPGLQRKVLQTFHYALSPTGFLLLGQSEAVEGSSELFVLRDKEHKIYARLATAGPPALDLGSGIPAERVATRPVPAYAARDRRTDVEWEAERLLLGRYAPASVVVNEAGEILHFRGDTETYLGHVQGTASLHLVRMARKELVPDLHRLFREARSTGTTQRKPGVVLRHRGQSRRVDLEVVPIKGQASGERSFLVLFEERPARGRAPSAAPAAPVPPRGEKEKDLLIVQLEQELVALRHYQQGVEEEQAASNEELQAANEEILSSNEELQSINEELETAKEELQSGNEELVTLNEELQNRNLELHRLNDDLDNFLISATLPLLMLGANLSVRRFTPAAAKLLNLIPADVGRPIGNLRTGLDMPDLEAVVLEVVDTLRPQEREVQDHEGRWWRLHVRPYRTRDNVIENAVLAFLDVDAMKRRQEVLEDARDFADAIVATVRQPLLILDADLRVRRANWSFYELFHLLPQATEGSSIYEIGDRQWDIPAFRATLEQVQLRDGSFEGQVIDHEFPSLGRKTLVLNARRLRQRAGKEEMILLAIEDRTKAARDEAERVELLERAQAAATAAEGASRLKDEFVATASHELRGPLNAIMGWVHLLSGGTLDETTTARALSVISRSVKAQTRLIDELLDLTRVMAGKLQLETRLVDLRAVVEAAMEAVRPAARAKGIDVGVSAEASSETVLGDPDRLQQAIWNLLSNAVKFTPGGGRVAVGIRRVGTDVLVEVTDTGQGIAASFLPHVFERFRQADSSPSRREAGLGLGLAIARQLVELHGGRLTAESPGEGRGSTFVICLPVPALRALPPRADGAAGAAARSWTAPEPSLLRGIRVLVVEDDPDGREVLRVVLEQCGAEVVVAASAAEALASFGQTGPDVLVSDIGMPEKDGYALIREIRKRPPEQGGRVPAVALTAYAAEEVRLKTAAAGFDAHMAKPAEPVELVRNVAALAGRSGAGA